MVLFMGFMDRCPGALRIAEAQFEHRDGRGHDAGRRDDRVEIRARGRLTRTMAPVARNAI